MFEEQYRADNDAITPSPALVDKTAAAMRQEAGRLAASSTPVAKAKPKKRKMAWRVVLAAAACVALLFAAFPVARLIGSLALPQETVPAADSYDQIYGAVREIRRLQRGAYDGPVTWLSELFGAFGNRRQNSVLGAGSAGKLESGPIVTTTTDEDASSSPDHSQTNLQVAGVQEADVVKTDGRYLYIVSGTTVRIVTADKEQPRELACITVPEKDDENLYRPFELYVTENRLIVLQEAFPADSLGYGETIDQYIGSYSFYDEAAAAIEAAVYDITDRTKPVLLHTQGQSGSYLSSRMVGDHLYLVTQHRVTDDINRAEPATYVPLLYTDGQASPLPAESVTLCPQPSEAQYVVVTGLNTAQPAAHTASRAVMGGGANLYASASSLYVAVTDYIADSRLYLDITTLLKFTLQDGQVAYAGTASVPGTLLNQFSMDEHEGYFRLVTTVSGAGSNLYILDKDLQTCGKLENVAPEESVYSVRFDGDIGYFVTFRQVDPLFTVDLTDPARPVILSALKIPGFSQYLHPYADGLLLGLGRDADPQTGAEGSLKLSMFDVSDPQQVAERHTTLLEMRYADSEALANHKAILVSDEKNLIAFPAAGEYLVFSYDDEAGFIQRAELVPEFTGHWLRGVYSGDGLYVCSPTGVTIFDMNSFSLLSSLLFS